MPGICYQKSHFLDFYIKKKKQQKTLSFLEPKSPQLWQTLLLSLRVPSR